MSAADLASDRVRPGRRHRRGLTPL